MHNGRRIGERHASFNSQSIHLCEPPDLAALLFLPSSSSRGVRVERRHLIDEMECQACADVSRNIIYIFVVYLGNSISPSRAVILFDT